MTDNDLVQWLRICLDGDEQAAREAGGAPWEATVPGMVHVSAAARAAIRGLRRQGYVATVDDNGPRYHIALHDPARALAEVEAKREIIRLHAVMTTKWDTLACVTCHPPRPGRPAWPCDTLRLLALPYADPHGYRQEWRP